MTSNGIYTLTIQNTTEQVKVSTHMVDGISSPKEKLELSRYQIFKKKRPSMQWSIVGGQPNKKQNKNIL